MQKATANFINKDENNKIKILNLNSDECQVNEIEFFENSYDYKNKLNANENIVSENNNAINKTNSEIKEQSCSIINTYVQIFDYIIYELGDEMPIQFRHNINFWKFGSFVFVITAMVI